MTNSAAWKAANPDYARAYGRHLYATRPHIQDANRKRAADRREERRVFLAQYKLDKGCIDCGYRAHACALGFDHRDPATKKFGIAARPMAPWDELLAEVAKCDVRCANCHAVRSRRERHSPGRRRNSEPVEFVQRQPRRAS